MVTGRTHGLAQRYADQSLGAARGIAREGGPVRTP